MSINKTQIREVPGSYGFPLFGLIQQGLAFKKNWREFFNDRQKKYNSNVFRAAAGIKAIVILDQKGISSIFDVKNISKLYGFGPLKPPPARVGKIIPTIFTNDKTHDQQKEFLMTLLRGRSKDMLKDFEKITSPYFSDWEKEKENFDWGQQLNSMLSDFLFGWVVGTKLEIKDLENWGFKVLPREIFPPSIWFGTPPVVASMNRLLKSIRSGSHFEMASELASDKAKLDKENAAKQILFYFGFNAWAALHGLTRSIISELTLNPDWQQKAADEIKTVMGDRKEPVFSDFSNFKILQAIIKETLRLHMPAPFAFGKARKDFIISSSSGEFLVRKGEVVNGAISHAHRDPEVFENPNKFDPNRFIGNENDQYLIWANGRDINSPTSNNRMCPGRDIVYLVMQLFFVKLIRNYTWSLKNKPHWNDKEFQPANRPDIDFICSKFEKRN